MAVQSVGKFKCIRKKDLSLRGPPLPDPVTIASPTSPPAPKLRGHHRHLQPDCYPERFARSGASSSAVMRTHLHGPGPVVYRNRGIRVPTYGIIIINTRGPCVVQSYYTYTIFFFPLLLLQIAVVRLLRRPGEEYY